MKKLLCCFLGLMSVGCTSLMPHPRSWTNQEKIVAIFFVAAHTANALTTEKHQDHPGLYYEMNGAMGRHPSDTEIGAYFSLTGAGALIVAHLYPELRLPLLVGYGTANCYWVKHDLDMMN